MFVSISIDLVGSTAIKKAIAHDRGGDFAAINGIYERYAEITFAVEDALYRFVAAHQRIDIRKLFLVKIIGDEYWFVYEVDDDDAAHLATVACALVSGLLDVFAQPRFFTFADAQGKEMRIDISMKALVDLLTNALHLPQRRYAYFEDKILDLLGGEARLAHADPADHAALCYGLNFRPRTPASEELLGVTRSDYVGVQVDRFFRAAKACKPRLVTIGETLWDRLALAAPPIAAGIEVHAVAATGPDPLPAGCRGVNEVIPAREMPGIDTDYTVWHLYTEATLRGDIYRPDGTLVDYVDPTRAFLARNGFYGLER